MSHSSLEEQKNNAVSNKTSKIVGLTGGIACGKSTISSYLIEKGIPVIDGDIVARQIVEPGTVGLRQIIDTFGAEFLNEDGTLNRRMLGDYVFADSEALEMLNGITKPLLLDAFQRQIKELEHYPMIVLDVALLLEDDAYRNLVDTVWLVTVTQEEQLERLMLRNGYSETEARNRIASQMNDTERRQYADVIIDNSGSIAETLAQIDNLIV